MIYETIVIGAGIEGSAAAHNLVKRGRKKVLLIEQVMNMATLHGGTVDLL